MESTPVELSIAARSDQLAIVRSVVERTLLLKGWVPDDVVDATLAVDEICSQLTAVSEPGTRLAVSLTLRSSGLFGQIDGRIPRGFELDTKGFGWRVLEAVTDVQSVLYVPAGEHLDVSVLVVKRSTPS